MSANAPDCSRSCVPNLLGELYTARGASDIDRLCALFAADAVLRISGSSDGKSIAIAAIGLDEIRSRLGVLVKTFRLSRQEVLSMVVESSKAAVHWRASISSRITGASVPMEMVDVFEVKEGRIASYVELFVPA